MSDTDHLDLAERVLSLELRVDRIVQQMEDEATQAHRALTLYPRCKALLGRLLGQATHHQGRASRLGRQLARCRDQLKDLQTEVDQVVETGNDEEQESGVRLRKNLQKIAASIRNWQTHSDELG